MSRIPLLVIAALSLTALSLIGGGISPTSAQKAPGSIGRYQTVTEGSRTRLFSVAMRLDTTTGKAWRTIIQGQQAAPWAEIEEAEGETLSGGSTGHYQIAAAYVGDTLGQELPAVVRTDTTTGKSWIVRVEPPRWRWAAIAEAAAAK
jgi:hypothetical protein